MHNKNELKIIRLLHHSSPLPQLDFKVSQAKYKAATKNDPTND